MTRRLLDFLKLQFSAAIFGIALLTLIMVTSVIWQPDWPIYRYDFLFVAVLVIQGALLFFKLETWSEARVIFVFHIVGVLMEVFKTSVNAWSYPEQSILSFPGLDFTLESLFGVPLAAPLVFQSNGVPLFTGFMYSAVGSYIARGWKLTDMKLTGAPPQWLGGLLALAIYVNFYTHHIWYDIRLGLFAGTVLLYGRCWAKFPERGRAPILGLFLLVAVLVYIAENIGSVSGTWLYPNQRQEWQPVPIGKLGSWFLLMIVSFSLVRLAKNNRTNLERFK